MRDLKIEELSRNSFSPFGTFVDPLDCGPALNGSGPLKFHPDRIVALFEHSNLVALSPQTIEYRPLLIDRTEVHEHTEEAFGGFGEDVFFHVGPPCAQPDTSQFRVFRLPAGWWARIKRGVWHHGPFVTGGNATTGMVILPPATYTHDCRVVLLEEPLAIQSGTK